MTTKLLRVVAALAVIAAIMGGGVAASPPGSGHTAARLAGTIKIGAAGPMTGRFHTIGASMKAGASLAVADINAAGGIVINGKHHRLDLLLNDDACNRAQAKTVAQSLAIQRVSLVVGHGCNGSSITAAQVYAPAQVLQIEPAARHPLLTDKRASSAIFRLAGRNDRQGLVAGRYLARAFKRRRIAILHDRTLASLALTKGVIRGLGGKIGRQGGSDIVLNASLSPGSNDYTTLVKKLASARVEIVYVASYVSETALLVRQIADAGLDVTVMSSDIIASQHFLDQAHEAGDGVLVTRAPTPRYFPKASSILGRLRKARQRDDLVALNAYVAVQVWHRAVLAAQSTNPTAVIAQLANSSFDTVLGKLSFDVNGDASVPSYAVFRWTNGKLISVRP